jgi:hypothetical protein
VQERRGGFKIRTEEEARKHRLHATCTSCHFLPWVPAFGFVLLLWWQRICNRLPESNRNLQVSTTSSAPALNLKHVPWLRRTSNLSPSYSQSYTGHHRSGARAGRERYIRTSHTHERSKWFRKCKREVCDWFRGVDAQCSGLSRKRHFVLHNLHLLRSSEYAWGRGAMAGHPSTLSLVVAPIHCNNGLSGAAPISPRVSRH